MEVELRLPGSFVYAKPRGVCSCRAFGLGKRPHPPEERVMSVGSLPICILAVDDYPLGASGDRQSRRSPAGYGNGARSCVIDDTIKGRVFVAARREPRAWTVNMVKPRFTCERDTVGGARDRHRRAVCRLLVVL